MTKFSINKAEAGNLLLEIRMAKMSESDALNHIKSAEFYKPAHTATIRRIAKIGYYNMVAQVEREALRQKEMDDAIASRSPQEKAQHAEYSTFLADLNAKGVTGKAKKRKLYKARVRIFGNSK